MVEKSKDPKHCSFEVYIFLPLLFLLRLLMVYEYSLKVVEKSKDPKERSLEVYIFMPLLFLLRMLR